MYGKFLVNRVKTKYVLYYIISRKYLTYFAITATSKNIIKRIRWSSEEKQAVLKYFGKPRDLSKLPSLTECQNAIEKHQVLKGRTAEQLKAWISNQKVPQKYLQ